MSDVQRIIETIGVAIEVVAVGIIVVGLGYALIQCGLAFRKPDLRGSAYRRLRTLSARILLLGLELEPAVPRTTSRGETHAGPVGTVLVSEQHEGLELLERMFCRDARDVETRRFTEQIAQGGDQRLQGETGTGGQASGAQRHLYLAAKGLDLGG